MKEIKNKQFEIVKEPREIAERIYELNSDMDLMDYEEEKEQELSDLENSLYYLKTICQNEYNSNYFRTFYKSLENL